MAPPTRRLLGQALSSAAAAGLLEPGLLAATTTAVGYWGPTPAAPYAAAAMRFPRRTAVVDDHGTLTYRDLHRRTNAVAGALQATDVDADTTVGILCRNHRGFIEANIAVAKLGARVVYLNTGLSHVQLEAVVDREGIDIVLADREFRDAVAECVADVVVVAPEDDADWSFPSLERTHRLRRLPTPFRGTEPVILTSGTTGVPKGARRPVKAGDAAAAIGMLDALPYRRGDVMLVAAPLFHAWGLSQHAVAASLAGTVVLRRRFDAAQLVADARRHQPATVVVVPVMLHRVLAADDTRSLPSSVRAVVSSGAALPADLATEWMDRHGDTLFNFYGSTEVGQVTIATPDDLREAPGTAGRPAPGVDLRIVDAAGAPVGPGVVGRIVVAGSAQFAGYTGGGTKPSTDNHMEIGDTGHLDEQRRLFVAGRVDDMIISGGENLYPAGIEDALRDHPAVAEVAVVGVPDDDLGQRVRAVMVKRKGARTPSDAVLKKHCAERLANYEVPREFVFVDELPRNETGKILRRTLAATG